MKKIFTNLFLLATLFLASTTLSAQTYYVLDAPIEKTLSYSLVGKEVIYEPAALTGPGAKLSFEISRNNTTAVGKTDVQQYVNGEWKTIESIMPSGKNEFHSYSYDIDLTTSKIRFYNGYGSYKRTIRNVKVTMATYADAPSATEWTAPTAIVGSPDESASTTMEWCNTSPFTLSMTGDVSQFTYSISNNASAGNYGTATISATYKHNVVGTHNATLTITTALGTHTIKLSGTTTKKNASITWNLSETKLPKGKIIENAAKANSGNTVTYATSDDTVIKVINDGTALQAVGLGTAEITATVAENDEWFGASDKKTFTVTNKTIQTIAWNDNLTRLKIGDEQITLSATVHLLVDAEHNEKVYSEERTALLTYTSADNNVVSVSGNVLNIVGEGETTLTAHIAGDENYEEASVVIPVKVRQLSTGCDDVLLLNYPTEIEFFEMNTNEITKGAIALNTSVGVPGQLTFQHKGEYWTFGIKYYNGSIKAQQSIDGGNNWSDIAGSEVTPTVGTYNSLTVALDRRATHIRFVRPKGGEGYHYINAIVVTPAQYLETSVSSISENAIIGDIITKDITINYANMKDEVMLSNTHDDVQLSTTGLGNGCGAFGTATIQVTIKPTQIGTITDEIVIADAVSGKQVRIPVNVAVNRNTQTIVWEQDLANINTTDNITLTASAKTAIHYLSTDSTVAYVEADVLKINKHGHVTITAVATQDEKYEQATATKDITINAVQPIVSTWPTVEPIAYAQALTTDMLIGGEAEVEGNFEWNTERNQTLLPGTYDLAVRFIPTNANYYASVDGTVSVTIVESVINDTPTFVGGTDQSWSTPTNWNLNRVPNAEDSVIITAPIEISDGAVEVLGMTINAGGAIHITPTGGLTVGEGGIVGATEDNFTIDNNTQGVGFLRINPDAKSIPTNVTINYTTRGKSGNPRDEVWQYIGAPGANMSMTNEGVLIYHWSEQNGWVKATTAMAPFVGYAISRTTTGNDTYTITTTPVFDNHTIELTRTPSGMDGSNLFVNSYLAPIDLAKFELGVDIVGDVEQTFYLFNSGSWNDWQNDGGGDESIVNGSSPGQYFAITPGSAALLDASMDQTTIPPMQGVYVVANESATIHLDYNKHVFTSTSADMNRPMRAPQQQDQNFMRVRIQVNSDNSGADRMYVIQHENATKGYDNGYDAKNILADGQANIYTHEQDGQMEISVTNQLDSTYIGFVAGDDAVYTLTFTSLVGEEMYLYDIEQDILIPLAEQEQYTFYAQPNSVNNQRFILLLNPDDAGNIPGGDGVATDIENLSASSHIWFSGKTLHVADAPANTTLAIYSACGMCIMAPNVIPSVPYALDLSHLPMGVYVLRLNNQAYKFVCK